jgi:lysophospholipid acyltransferase (LPLAT)-like uncharacterized protein
MGAWTKTIAQGSHVGDFAARFWTLVAWPIGTALAIGAWLIGWTAGIDVRGDDYKGPAVYVNWHRHLPLLIVHHGSARRWMMVSGAPYMAPIASWCRLAGLRLVRGATGAGGKQGFAQLDSLLQRGDSVVLAVDGPAGPAFKVKPGCVELARQRGVPIIAVGYGCRRGHTVGGRWDRSLLGLPFDHVKLDYGPPIYVDPSEPTLAACERVGAMLERLESEHTWT